MSRWRFVVSVAVTILVISPFAFGCWGEGEDVTVENRSRETVVVFEDDAPLELVHPNVTQRFHILRFSGSLKYSVQSFDSRKVLAERSFTWDEIEREDCITIVIE